VGPVAAGADILAHPGIKATAISSVAPSTVRQTDVVFMVGISFENAVVPLNHFPPLAVSPG
jgi:hypothetical protein